MITVLPKASDIILDWAVNLLRKRPDLVSNYKVLRQPDNGAIEVKLGVWRPNPDRPDDRKDDIACPDVISLVLYPDWLDKTLVKGSSLPGYSIQHSLLYEKALETLWTEMLAEFGNTPEQAEDWERYTNEETGFEFEVFTTGEIFTPRFFACHSLPCRPYHGLQAFDDNELPDWNCDLQDFLEIKKKVDALIEIIPSAWNISDLQQRFNDITARGRQAIFEKEILWLWGGDMSSLMEKSEITEDNKITHNNIGQRILEHEENEEKQLARNEGGERIDPPELEPSSIFWTKLKWEGHHHANWDEIQRAQEIRRVWLKVYEELARLYDTHVAISGQTKSNRRKIRDSTQKRAEMFKAIKDAHPRLSYQAVAMRAQQQLTEQGQVEEVTWENVRSAYRAMGWHWERADKIR